MKIQNTTAMILLLTLAMLAPTAVLAEPITGVYTDDPTGCDSHGPLNFVDELGDAFVFPADEAIMVTSVQSSDPRHFLCVGDDGVFNEWLVTMSNVSGQAWKDVFFVADEGVAFSNYDGNVEDTTFPGRTRAMRIDDASTNRALIAGDVNNNEIFDIGETWEFLVDNFVSPIPGGPAFQSVGKFSASSGVGFDTISTASILVNPVPEPSGVFVLLTALACGWGARRQLKCG